MIEVAEVPPLPRREIAALGVPTSYYEAGNRNSRPLLLLHGMSTSGDSFRELMTGLADDNWLIAPDIPGFGYTENTEPYTIPHLVEWLAAFIDALELPQAALVGHSFGGLLSTSYALAYPEDVRSLLLFAPALLAAQEFPDWARRAGETIDFLGMFDLGVAVSQSSLMVERQVRNAFYEPAELPASLWERRLGDYERARASAAVLKAAATYDLSAEVSKLEKKLWIVWGRNDPVLDAAHADQLAERLPQAQVFVLPRCGHVPMIERLDRSLAIARAFLAEEESETEP